MATATPYLGLVKPAEGEKYDVDILNANNDKVDAGVKDATEKPSKGTLAYKETAATSPAISTTATIIDTIDGVSLVAGRYYRVTFTASSVSNTASTPLQVACRKGAVGNLDSAEGTGIAFSKTIWTAPISASGMEHSLTYTFKAAATETVILKITAQRVAGSATVTLRDRIIEVEDKGKAT